MRLPTIPALCLLALPAAADTATLEAAMILGPLPVAPATTDSPRVYAAVKLIPEIDPGGWLPQPEERVKLGPDQVFEWRHVNARSGSFHLEGPGVWWLAARLSNDRWDELTFTAPESVTVFVDGEETDGELVAPLGEHFVFLRVEASGEGADVQVKAQGERARLGWDQTPRRSLSEIDRGRHFPSFSSLAVAPGGNWVARYASLRNPRGEGRRGGVVVFDAEGNRAASDLGGPDARPVAFSPVGEELLLRRRGEKGTDLLLWSAPHGPVRTIVTDEPGLGYVKFSPEGSFLLLQTTRGLDADERDGKSPRRWDVLRERVADWGTLPHLQLVEIATGARRVLTRPGDWTLDDAVWSTDGASIFYGRTVPISERPWFATELRALSLSTGGDRLLATFVAGWEVRPQAFLPHPDRKHLFFLASPYQVGDAFGEHNAPNKQVWELDFTTGAFERISLGMRYAFAGGRNLPIWDPASEALVLPANAGSADYLVRLREGEDGWTASRVSTARTTGANWASSPDASAVAYTASSPAHSAALYRQMLDAYPDRLETSEADFAARRKVSRPPALSLAGIAGLWKVSEAESFSYEGPGGETIEAWWYPPSTSASELFDASTEANRAKVPLIVYYYGGSSPVTRGFNLTHQFWAANGYAVLVINPRGAYGYGDEFADHHANDGGAKAAADVIAGTRALLGQVPQLDPARVGCYGGSYGGFLTMHLVAHTDLFAAACSMYGIADQATYWGQGTWGWTYGDMANGGALPWRDPEFFLRASPLYQAGEIHTPLLLLHGEEDDNVTPGESSEMFTALQVLGRDVELVTFPGEGHGIAGSWKSYTGHRTMMLEWFDRWLKDQPEAWDARWK